MHASSSKHGATNTTKNDRKPYSKRAERSRLSPPQRPSGPEPGLPPRGPAQSGKVEARALLQESGLAGDGNPGAPSIKKRPLMHSLYVSEVSYNKKTL